MSPAEGTLFSAGLILLDKRAGERPRLVASSPTRPPQSLLIRLSRERKTKRSAAIPSCRRTANVKPGGTPQGATQRDALGSHAGPKRRGTANDRPFVTGEGTPRLVRCPPRGRYALVLVVTACSSGRTAPAPVGRGRCLTLLVNRGMLALKWGPTFAWRIGRAVSRLLGEDLNLQPTG